MTFLLQKHHAIHRTQVRDSLRSFASGIALTGRLAAACLLLAGFLGVGSATAQAPPTILRLGGGDVVLKLDDLTTLADNDYLDVHHFVIGTGDPVNNPSEIPEGGGAAVKTSFLIGGLALVTVDDVNDHKLTISPVATGSFKIALSPDGEAELTKGDDMTNVGQPHDFVVVSANAPELTGKTGADSYNQQAKDDRTDITLTPRDNIKADAIAVIGLFTDPDDVVLTYTVKADTVGRGKADGSDGEAIVNATISKDSLMISLTDKAKAQDSTDVWLTATDASGEYARKRYYISTGSPTNPYVKKAIGNVIIREDAASADIATIMLAGTADDPVFADEALTATGTNLDPDTGTNTGDGLRALNISIAIGDKNATRVPVDPNAADFTWVTTPMNAIVKGNGGEAPTLEIDPRAAGEVTFTVTATDRGPACPVDDGKTPATAYITIDKDGNAQTNLTLTTDAAAVKCFADADGDNTEDAGETIALYKDSKTATTTFKVTIVSKTTPSVTTNAITLKALDSEKGAMGAMTIDLDDLNGATTGTPTAFNKHGQTLTYAVKLAKEKKKEGTKEVELDVAVAEVEGSKVTVTPIWRAGDITVEATVTAMNGIAGETAERKFNVTVSSATTPVVTQDDRVQLVLTNGFEVMRGDKMELDLRDIFKAGKDVPKVPLFLDPNAAMDDQLPGGLQLRIRPADVVTAHRYDDQSSDNDIYTSMGRLMLDPKTAMLTFYATAPNTMKVTIHATDRERKVAMASTMITVPEVPSAEAEELPTEVSLSQNYPNPFNPRTTIEYALPEAGDVSLIVYDMLGREVTTLLEGPQAAGRHTVNFDANHLSNGTYVYRLVAPNKTITRTMVLVK